MEGTRWRDVASFAKLFAATLWGLFPAIHFGGRAGGKMKNALRLGAPAWACGIPAKGMKSAVLRGTATASFRAPGENGAEDSNWTLRTRTYQKHALRSMRWACSQGQPLTPSLSPQGRERIPTLILPAGGGTQSVRYLHAF